MITYEQHVMQPVGARGAGAEEWVCPTCGRRLLVSTEPAFTTTVLATGDIRATHCGGLAGRSAGFAERSFAAPAPGFGAPAAEPERASGGADADMPLEMLRPWLKALKAIEDEGFAI